MSSVYYAIYDSEGGCVCDGYDLQAVLARAEVYYTDLAAENGHIGYGSEDVVLIWDYEDLGLELQQQIRITWEIERDHYDGGRFDYLAAIGAVKTI